MANAASARAVLSGSVLSLFVQPTGCAPLAIEITVAGKTDEAVSAEAREGSSSPDWKHLDMEAIQGCVSRVVSVVLAGRASGDPEPEGGWSDEIGDFGGANAGGDPGDEQPVVEEAAPEGSAPEGEGSEGEGGEAPPPGEAAGEGEAPPPSTGEDAAGAGAGVGGSAEGSGGGESGTQSGG